MNIRQISVLGAVLCALILCVGAIAHAGSTKTPMKKMTVKPTQKPQPKVMKGHRVSGDYFMKTHSVVYRREKEGTYSFRAKVTNKSNRKSPELTSQRLAFDQIKNAWVPASGRMMAPIDPQTTVLTDGIFTYDSFRFTKIKFVLWTTGSNAQIVGEDIYKLNLPTPEEKETIAVELPHEQH